MSGINERLTYRNQYGEVDLFGAESSVLREGLETEREVNALTAALEKLAAYEDAEEQGRLLPVKIGDTAYQVDACRVYKSKIKSLIYDTDGVAFDGRAIGKAVFLTRAEAEAALKGGA